MRWYMAKLFEHEQQGVDELGVPIAEEVETGYVLVQSAPYSPDKNDAEGNPHHDIQRSFKTKALASRFRNVVSFMVSGKRYKLIDVANLGHDWRIITGVRSKP